MTKRRNPPVYAMVTCYIMSFALSKEATKVRRPGEPRSQSVETKKETLPICITRVHSTSSYRHMTLGVWFVRGGRGGMGTAQKPLHPLPQIPMSLLAFSFCLSLRSSFRCNQPTFGEKPEGRFGTMFSVHSSESFLQICSFLCG